MSINVDELYHFYHTPLGDVVAADLCRLVHHIWPHPENQKILSLGFGFPVLRQMMVLNPSVIAFTPDFMGGMLWPHASSVQSAIVHETELPLEDHSIDRMLLLHMFEHSAQPHKLLREAFRVIKTGGELLVITPNRRGLWSYFDQTPFGQGRPYTMTQLSNDLNAHSFEPLCHERALYTPPYHLPKFLKGTLDVIGSAILRKFSGVIAIQARKVELAGLSLPVAERAHKIWQPDLVPTCRAYETKVS